MKKILVTGATGFIGRHCLPILSAKGYEVHAVSSKVTEKTSPDVKWHQVDLLDSAQVSDLFTAVEATHLLHFAWYAVPGKIWTSLDNFRWVQASLSILQHFARTGGKRAVMAGTCAEYDWNYGYCSEKITPLLPKTVYGICKHSLQIMLEAFTKQTGISTAWGRIFFLYGPHEHPDRLVPSVIRSALQGKPIRCSHGNQIRDFLHVQDVADAFVQLLNSEVSGPVNIASGRPVVLKKIIYKIAKILNQNDLIELGALQPPPDDPRLLTADVDRLSDEIGWRPRHNLDHGLEETIHWWKNQISDYASENL